jgi:MFS family permease
MFLVNGFIYTSFNVMIRTVAKDLGWSDAERAVVSTGIASGMIWFVFIAGIALDRFSPKRLLASFVFFASAAIYLRGSITQSGPYFTLMFVYGAFSAFIMPAINKINSLWFDRKSLAFANGCLTASSPLGQVTGNLLTVPISNALGSWSLLFMCQGVLLAAAGVIFVIFAKDRRNIDAALSSEKIKTEAELGVWKNIKSIMRVPQMWIYAVANASLLGMIYAAGSQGQIVLQGDPHWALDKSISGIVPSFNNLSSMFCYILMPIIISRFFKENYEKNYKKIAVISGVIATLVTSYGYTSYNIVVICACMAISGVCYGTIVPAPKVLMLQLPDISGARAGTALGLFITIERLSQAALTGFIGGFIALYPNDMAWVLSKFWLIMLISPLMLTISVILEKKAEKPRSSA